MKVVGVLFFAAAVLGVNTKRHKKEWEFVDVKRASREHLSPAHHYDSSVCRNGPGFYRDPTDCHQFVRCVDEFNTGKNFHILFGRCQPGLVFDENVSSCNWPELAAPCSNSPERLTGKFRPVGNGQEPLSQDNVIADQYPQQEVHKEVRVPQQEVQKEIQVPQQEVQKEIHVPQQEVQKEVHVPQQEVQKEVHVPQQEVQKEIRVPHQEVQKEVHVSQQEVQVPQQQAHAPQESENEVLHSQSPHTEQDKWQQIEQQQQQELPEVPQNQQVEENDHSQHDPQPVVQEKVQEPIEQQKVDDDHQFQEQVGFQEVHDPHAEQVQVSQSEQNAGQQQALWWIPDNGGDSTNDQVREVPHATNEPVLCSKEGFYRHPLNCSQFVRCVETEQGSFSVHFFECGERLSFDEKSNTCIVGECKPSRSKRQAPDTPLECSGEGFFRHPVDCRSFYRCVRTSTGSYETHLFSCPETLVFDEEYATCNWPDKAPPCESGQRLSKPSPTPARQQYKPVRTTPRTQNDYFVNPVRETIRWNSQKQQYTTPAPRGQMCSRQGFFKHDSDCTKFYKCVRKDNYFVRYELSCPDNYAYDDSSSRCLSMKYMKNCQSLFNQNDDDEVSSTTTTETSSTGGTAVSGGGGEEEDIQCDQEGFFRNPNDCNKFYRCVAGEGDFIRYDFKCPDGLVFDEDNSVCNWPDQSAPCASGGSRNGNGNGGEGPSEGERPGEGGRPNEEGPGEGGRPNEEDPSEGEGPGEGGRPNEEGPGEGGIPNEEGPSEGEGPNPPTEKPSTTTTRRPTRRPATSRTTSAPQESSTAEGVDESSKQGEGSEGSEGGSEGSESGCSKEGFFRNEEDCNKFYRCVNYEGQGFVRYDFACPDGLVFDEDNSVCNWPDQSAPCEGGSGGKGDGSEGGEGGGNEGGKENERGNGGGKENERGNGGGKENERGNGGGKGNERGNGGGKENERGNGGGSEGGKGDKKEPKPLEDEGTSTTTTRRPTRRPGTSRTTSAPRESSSTSEPEASKPEEGSKGSEGGSEGSESGCSKEGFFRNEEDCNKFYRCVNYEGQGFVRYDFACPDGLVFDEDNSVCNWPDQSAPCEGGSGGKDDGSEGGEGGGNEGGKENEIGNGGGKENERGNGGVKENERGNGGGKGDKEEPKPLEDEGTSTTTTRRPTRRPGTSRTTSAPRESSSTSEPERSKPEEGSEGSEGGSEGSESGCSKEGFFRNEEDCNKFYRCVNYEGQGFVRYDFACPDGLVFDEDNSVCNWPDQSAPCEGGSGGKGDGSEGGEGGGNVGGKEKERGNGGGKENERGNGGGNEGGKGDKEEPKPLEDEGTSTTTTRRPTRRPGTSRTTSAPRESSSTSEPERSKPEEGFEGSEGGSEGSESGCGKEGFFRNEEDCNKFYRCVNYEGQGFVRYDFACPDGLVFDETNSVCNWPDQSAPCEGGSGGKGDGSEGGKGNERGNGGGNEGGKGEGNGGGKEGGKENERGNGGGNEGGKGEGGNGGGNEGEQPNPLEDQGTSTTTTRRPTRRPGTSRTTPAPVSSTEKAEDGSSEGTGVAEVSDNGCSEEGFFRNEEDCNKFYRCVNNGEGRGLLRYDFDCPDGLVFDESNSVCNWPDQSAPCDGSSGGGNGGKDDGSEGNGGKDDGSEGNGGEDDGSEGNGGEDDGSEGNGGKDGGNEGNRGQEGEDQGEDQGEPAESSSPPTSTTTRRPTRRPPTSRTTTTSAPSTGSGGESSTASERDSENIGGSTSSGGRGTSSNGGECTEAGFFRNPEDCNKFYRCVDYDGNGQEFVKYDFSCPEGLVFDESNSVCNWPDQSAPCEGGSGGQTDSRSTTASSATPGSEESSTTQAGSTSRQTTSRPTSRTTSRPTERSTTASPSRRPTERSTTASPSRRPTERTTTASPSRRPTERTSTASPSRRPTERTTTTSSTTSRGSQEGGVSSTTRGEGSGGGSSGECTEAGFFRNPDDCNKFYRCVDFNGDGQEFVKYDFDCPEGLVFDEVNSVCNWPEQSPPCEGGSGTTGGSSSTAQTDSTGGASSTTASTTTTQRTTRRPERTTTRRPTTQRTTTTAVTTPATGSTTSSSTSSTGGECTEEGFFRDPDDCSKYYRCLDEGDGTFTREEFSCEEDEVFDEEMRYCNSRDLAPPCDQSSTTSQGTTEGTIGESRRRECTESGFFRCAEDCSKFYRCVDEDGSGQNFIRYNFTCPEGLLFDEQNKRCDFPSDQLTCDTATTSSDGSTTEGTTGGTTPSSAGTTSGSTGTTSGSTGTTSGSTGTTSGTTSGSTAGTSDECTEEGYFRNRDDCSRYYRCLDEGDGTFTREDFACEEDEVFDEEMQYCNRRDLAPPCDETSTSNETTTERRECPEAGFYRCPEDCTKFYRCVDEDGTGRNFIRYNFTCPEGLIFDEQNRRCDWPSSELTCDDGSTTTSGTGGTSAGTTSSDSGITSSDSGTTSSDSGTTSSDSGTTSSDSGTTSSDSGTTSSDSGTTSSSTGTSGPSSECTEEGFFRDPNDCSRYYRCLDEGDGTFTREDFVCEEDEVFDEEMRYCNRRDLAPPCEEGSTTSSGTTGSSSTTDSSTTGSSSTTDSGTTGSSSTTDSGTTGTSSTTDSGTTGTSSTTDSGTSTTSDSSTTASSNNSECQEEGFKRHPDDCTKFYRCVDFEGEGRSFTKYDFECPEGLVFDENNNVCNWPSSVPSCEGRAGGSTTTGDGSGTSTTQSGTDSSDGTGSTSGTTDGTGSTSATTDGTGSTSGTTDGTGSTSGTTDGTGSTSGTTDGTGSTSGTTDGTGTTSGTTDSSDSTTSGGGSSRNIECTREGFFRHPDDCTKFYRCVDFAGTGESYTRYDFECPRDLVFDEVNSVCNWPNQSPPCDAGARNNSTSSSTDGEGSTTPSMESTTSTGGSSSGSTDGTTSGTTSSGTDSTTDGTTSGASSSSGTDSTTDGTTSGTPSSGTDSTRDGTTSGTSTAGDRDFQCEEEGFFRDRDDCRKYYECKRDEDTEELVKIDCACPEGHVFDEDGWYCNSEELTQSCDNDSFLCPNEGFFRDPDDCTRYYECTRVGEGGLARRRHQCTDGNVFDEEGRYCNAPELSQPCDNSTTGTTPAGGSSTSTSASTDGTSGGTTSGGTTSGGTTSEGTTSEGTTSGGTTSGGTTSSGQSESTSGQGGDCTEEGFFRNSEDCTRYYQCTRNEDSGELEREDFACPDGRVFDEGGNYCNDPALTEEPCDGSSTTRGDGSTTTNADGSSTTSGDRSTTTSGDGSSTTTGGDDSTTSGSTTSSTANPNQQNRRGSGGDPECTEAGFFRHPRDCNKFYRCVDFRGTGQSFVRFDFDCPEGLHFDEVNSVCNWPTMTPGCDAPPEE